MLTKCDRDIVTSLNAVTPRAMLFAHLRYVGWYSIAEIAELVGVTRQGVHDRIIRACRDGAPWPQDWCVGTSRVDGSRLRALLDERGDNVPSPSEISDRLGITKRAAHDLTKGTRLAGYRKRQRIVRQAKKHRMMHTAARLVRIHGRWPTQQEFSEYKIHAPDWKRLFGPGAQARAAKELGVEVRPQGYGGHIHDID